MIRALREVPLFSRCSDQEFAAIAGFCDHVHVLADSKIFKAGEPSEAFFFVVDGLIALLKTSAGGKEKVIEFIESGQTFAEAVVISGQSYPVTAVALMDTQLVRIDAGSFRSFLLKHPSVSLGMLSALSARLHQLVGQISSLSLLNAEQRVAEYLLENVDKLSSDSTLCHLPNPRRVLASRLNLTPETLCRVLTVFRQRNWIELPSAGTANVLDAEALHALVGEHAGGLDS